MDMYKYVALMVLIGILGGMGALLMDDRYEFADYLALQSEGQFAAQSAASGSSLTDDGTALTPQNENTQSEGSGGVGVTQTAIRVWEMFRLIIQGANERQYEADVASQNATGMHQVIQWALNIIYALLVSYGLLKLYTWFKNKDTT